jgi:hypothetical protein
LSALEEELSTYMPLITDSKVFGFNDAELAKNEPNQTVYTFRGGEKAG